MILLLIFQNVIKKVNIFSLGITFAALLIFISFIFSSRRNPPIGSRDYIGWAIWTIGFVFEVVADAQKTYFRSYPSNKVNQRHNDVCAVIYQLLRLFQSKCLKVTLKLFMILFQIKIQTTPLVHSLIFIKNSRVCKTERFF